MQILYTLLAALAAYLIGSLSFAVIVSRAMGLNDPRSYGSGNPGATNVLRSGNKAAAVLTLLLDALKGFVPVFAVKMLGPAHGLEDGALALVGVAAFLGHLWPLFFKFQGGKGVATAAGVLLGFNPWLGLATIAAWAVVAAITRYSCWPPWWRPCSHLSARSWPGKADRLPRACSSCPGCSSGATG